MSSLVNQILGRSPLREDSPPVQTARPHVPARKGSEPEDKEEEKLKKRARRSSVVASIIGMSESDGESIIPDDAKAVDVFSDTHEIPGMRDTPDPAQSGPAEPAITSANGEELIPPAAALVAPDITPDVLKPIDSSRVPAPPGPIERPAPPPGTTPPPEATAGQPQHALDTLLGRQNPSPQPAAASPVTAESFIQTINPGQIKSRVAESVIPASEGGSEMPLHKEGDGKAIYAAFRRFAR